MSTLTLDRPTTGVAPDRPFNWAILSALLGVLVLSGVSVFTGVADLSPIDFLTGTATDEQKLNLVASRIPRTAAVLLAGASLALAGLLMQMLVRNRFVEPSTVGTSESAAVGLLIVAMLFPAAPLPLKMLVAIITALIGTALFLRVIRSLPPHAPVVAIPLVGIMLAGIIAAGTTFVAQRNDLLQSLGIWMAGDFSGVLRGRYEGLWLLAGVGVLMWLFADRFTVASLGKDTATSLGLSYRMTLNLGLGLVAVASAVTLVIVGSIAFVGLIVPNLISMWRGDNLRRNIGWAALAGSGFVLVCDLIARTINHPYEVPVGTVSGIIGGAIFLGLLLTGKLRVR
ncbi:ABC transporter permease [Tessaracoccus flavus]|uniref:Iron ABC transporter permease n=1 Tax=Tessaracoccus flavus TaxID=1610493 RepID=A0A1Q2CGC4_9ACTN|nr:iron chelate uptake ABC transporter family permease subunit [Tessaracoccus flavus]AQP45168.1 iron ABC transporter permease [Tessaracoccus flavus]SDY54447.1 iron complex transport system permease protein [Tessaracoccus flavus]